MAKPQSYKYSYVALHSIPYVEQDGSRPASCGGVLGRGGVVWTDSLHQQPSAQVTAYLDTVGVVCLDPRWLVAPDLYRGLQR